MDLSQENPISAHFYLRLVVCRLSEEVDKLFCRRGEIWCDCRGLGEGISKTCEGCNMSRLTTVTAEQNPKQQKKVEPWDACMIMCCRDQWRFHWNLFFAIFLTSISLVFKHCLSHENKSLSRLSFFFSYRTAPKGDRLPDCYFGGPNDPFCCSVWS